MTVVVGVVFRLPTADTERHRKDGNGKGGGGKKRRNRAAQHWDRFKEQSSCENKRKKEKKEKKEKEKEERRNVNVFFGKMMNR